ncbi:hypothetical protein [Streptomyces sp. NPDC059783]|uniref:hypothetical protein n=1 Tax=Streptomyces sp. NPDC059783 TaxID=3346944 RepID=UPI00366678AE
MRTTHIRRPRLAVIALAAAVVAGGLGYGAAQGMLSTAGSAHAGSGSGMADTVVNAAAEHSQKRFSGTFRSADGCPYLVTRGGTHYYLPGYTIGGNGALYKKGGGFIAYPGWRIQANGTSYRTTGGTACATWGTVHRIKAKSIYATTTQPPSGTSKEGCRTSTSAWQVRNHMVRIKTADVRVRITRCVDASGALTSQTTSRIHATTTTAGDLLYGVTVTPESTPSVIKASGTRYVLKQDVEHKTCLGTKAGPFCSHNNITFTITVNRTGTAWEVSAKSRSADDDVVPA